MALRASTDIWASRVQTAALAAIGFAALEAILRPGASRAFWLGFAVFGVGYLALAGRTQSARRLPTTPLLEWLRPFASRPYRDVGDRLLVVRQGTPTPSTILEVKDGSYKVNLDGWAQHHDEWGTADRIAGDLLAGQADPGASTALASYLVYTGASGALPLSGRENFLIIGHALAALVAAAGAGLVARYVISEAAAGGGRGGQASRTNRGGHETFPLLCSCPVEVLGRRGLGGRGRGAWRRGVERWP